MDNKLETDSGYTEIDSEQSNYKNYMTGNKVTQTTRLRNKQDTQEMSSIDTDLQSTDDKDTKQII